MCLGYYCWFSCSVLICGVFLFLFSSRILDSRVIFIISFFFGGGGVLSVVYSGVFELWFCFLRVTFLCMFSS